ncbi:MAG: GIY-YIG nuclease family protein [Lewinellaceae bacterium]|nr:GIY-YIG nuclease family protein [Lewinellaceae bacterium]
MSRYAIIDVETTGGTARFERITEIAIVLHDGDQVLDTFSTLLNPERSIPWSITQLTGISNDMVADAPKFFEVAKQVVKMTEGAIFVAHNVQFDYSFVREEFARLGYPFSRKQLCTVRLSRQVFPGLPSYSLSNLKRHFGIFAERSHRALDDTLATTKIFEMILQAQQGQDSIRKIVNYGVKESRLPPAITLERLHDLPETCGVYYLYDAAGSIIYVGKSLNIRKRIFEHFADNTPKGEKMRSGVADIGFEETGSELAALLLESAEIKKHQPPINRALRTKNFNACIVSYTNQSGYLCMAAGKNTRKKAQNLTVVAEYPKLDSARAHLQSLVRQFELCEKLCNLDFHEHACFQYNLKRCYGACVDEETVESYNERVQLALAQMDRGVTGSFVVVDRGRNDTEKCLIGVRDGAFCGFTYLDASEQALAVPELLEQMKSSSADPDASRIIRTYLDGGKRVQVLRL